MHAAITEGLQIVTLEDAPSVLCLAGELDLGTVERVRARLRELDDRPVVLDLSGLTFRTRPGSPSCCRNASVRSGRRRRSGSAAPAGRRWRCSSGRVFSG